jgi:hypothetical protein
MRITKVKNFTRNAKANQKLINPKVLNDLRDGVLSSKVLLERRLYLLDFLRLIRLLKYCGAIP